MGPSRYIFCSLERHELSVTTRLLWGLGCFWTESPVCVQGAASEYRPFTLACSVLLGPGTWHVGCVSPLGGWKPKGPTKGSCFNQTSPLPSSMQNASLGPSPCREKA